MLVNDILALKEASKYNFGTLVEGKLLANTVQYLRGVLTNHDEASIKFYKMTDCLTVLKREIFERDYPKFQSRTVDITEYHNKAYPIEKGIKDNSGEWKETNLIYTHEGVVVHSKVGVVEGVVWSASYIFILTNLLQEIQAAQKIKTRKAFFEQMAAESVMATKASKVASINSKHHAHLAKDKVGKVSKWS